MNNGKNINKPYHLKKGDTIGIVSPSFPGHLVYRKKYLRGIYNLKKLGYNIVEGSLTRNSFSESYRTASAKLRAQEINELFLNKNIRAIIASIGGDNAASLIPYLDFDLIKDNPKIFCGYSDITSLHLAILKYSNLSTFYGPSIITSFGEWYGIDRDTISSFMNAVSNVDKSIEIKKPLYWSNDIPNALTSEWKSRKRKYQLNNIGWSVIKTGACSGPIIVANLSTLLKLAGSPYFPNLENHILFLEEMNASMASLESSLCQLKLIGVFDVIKGLVFSKPEKFISQQAPFDFADLIIEILGSSMQYPIIYNFDCGHTTPIITLAEECPIQINATNIDKTPSFLCLDSMVR